jgi:hypothetical protein
MPIKNPKNIALFALSVKAYLVANPGVPFTDAAQHFNVSQARISQLTGIADNIPDSLLKKLSNSYDSILPRKYSGKRLLKMSALQFNLPSSLFGTIADPTPITTVLPGD